MIVVGFFAILLLIYLSINYCLLSFGLQQMARKKGLEKPGLAWIPIYNLYMFGLIAGDSIEVFGKKVNNLSTIYLLSGILLNWTFLKNTYISSYGIIAILFVIIHFFTIQKIFDDFSVSNPTLLSIISIIFTFLFPLIIFSISFNSYKGDVSTIEL